MPSLVVRRLAQTPLQLIREIRAIRGKILAGYMQKPNVRGPSPSRKAHLALQEKLNRPHKPPPLLRTPINSRGRKRHR
jgi:hypothetical protein